MADDYSQSYSAPYLQKLILASIRKLVMQGVFQYLGDETHSITSKEIKDK